MNLSRIFIERPVMTALVCFAILLFGFVAFRALPVAALPSVDYPTIQVQAALPGANPETMASSVATPLEREFSTIAGIESMTSTNSQGTPRSRFNSRSIAISMPRRRMFSRPSQRPAAACRQMPRPPSYQKVESGRAAHHLPCARVDDAADVHGQRICGYTTRAAHLHDQRRVSGRRSLERRNMPCASRWIPMRSPPETSESMKCSGPSRPATRIFPPARLEGDKQAFTIQSTGQLTNAAAYRPLIVAWRNGTPVRLEQLATSRTL